MLIIDKHRDYYDYLSHVYGVDKQVIFDRRKSIEITDKHIAEYYSIEVSKDPIYKHLYPDYDKYILLEVGYKQYLIEVTKIRYKAVDFSPPIFVSCKMKLVHTFKNNKHYFDKAISIHKVDVHYKFTWKKRYESRKYIINNNFSDTITDIYDRSVIELPILKNTQITSLIDPQEIWQELQNYISSLNNDKDITIPMNDVEKAEIHGFDKITSFRNPIK